MYRIIGFLTITSILFFSCNKEKNVDVNTSKRIVSVGEVSLYESDIKNITFGMTVEDSISFVNRYVKSWIRNELLLEKAKMNLTKEELNVEEQVKSYRESLLINQYKQKYVKQHLDTLVQQEEVEEYVQKYAENFILSEPIYQFYFARILSKNKGDIKKIKKIFAKDSLDLTKDYELESSTLLISYDEDWYTAREIFALLPENIETKKIRLQRHLTVKEKGKDKTFLIKIRKMIPAGKVSPATYVTKKVKEIIVHKRKINIAKKLEYDVYEDAKKNNLFKIY